MEACDALIVGGGPAGSSCARRLSRGGLDVIVLDRARFPRDKVCAGWITPAVVDELELDVAEYAQGRVIQPITGFRTGVLGGAAIETHFGRVVSYGIRRCEFDHYLLERCGARLVLGTPFESLRRDGPAWVVNERFRAPLIIGAGGHFCPVARATSGENPAPGVVVLAREAEFELDEPAALSCVARDEVPELYFCGDLKGYAWCFRKGNFLNIGLGREGETRLARLTDEFYAWLEAAGRIPTGGAPRFHGHAYRLDRGPRRRAAQEGILLIGDSAGLAYPQSGEGIRPAVESGLLAAEAILASRTRPEGLERRYEQLLASRFGDVSAEGEFAAWVPRGLRQLAARRLLASRWFARRVLIERWFLHAHQPALEFARVPA